ncbi:MAG: sugar phosphate isomerase/epimerase family protein [Bryobacteraceae bacterium]
MNRREAIARTTALLSPCAVAAPAHGPRFIKGICTAVFPTGTPYSECFSQARNAGFDAVEVRMEDRGQIHPRSKVAAMAPIADAAAAHRLTIACLWVLTPSAPSLVSPDADVRAIALERIRKGIELAPALRCNALLAAPGVLGRGPRMEATHDQAWELATKAYRAMLPLARRAKVTIAPENVWSKFLVSPRDMRSFVDQFRSPSAKVHFDTGNVMQYGYPEDWILTLGSRIHRIHLKDYKLSAGGVQGRFVPLLEGDVQWKNVMQALKAIDYRGFVSAELGPDPQEKDLLLKVSRAVDRILEMA